MAIVKLSSSKKAVQFIDDDGNLFMAPASGFRKVLDGEWKSPMVLTRMPVKVDSSRFKKSPVYSPATGVITGDDSFSQKFLKDTVHAAAYVDRVVE